MTSQGPTDHREDADAASRPDYLLRAKRAADVAAPYAYAAFAVALFSKATEGLAGAFWIASAAASQVLTVAAAGLGLISTASTAARLATTGRNHPDDTAEVKNLRAEFRRSTWGFLGKQALSSSFMGFAGLTFANFLNNGVSGMGGGEALPASMASALVGTAVGLWAYRDGAKASEYETAISASGPPAPKPGRCPFAPG